MMLCLPDDHRLAVRKKLGLHRTIHAVTPAVSLTPLADEFVTLLAQVGADLTDDWKRASQERP